MEVERLKWEARAAHLVVQLEAQTGSRRVEHLEKPTSTPESSVDLAVTPTRGPTEVVLRMRPVAEVETTAEPEYTPRSTGSSSLVSLVLLPSGPVISYRLAERQVYPCTNSIRTE